jgi:hypothetical protein
MDDEDGRWLKERERKNRLHVYGVVDLVFG